MINGVTAKYMQSLHVSEFFVSCQLLVAGVVKKVLVRKKAATDR